LRFCKTLFSKSFPRPPSYTVEDKNVYSNRCNIFLARDNAEQINLAKNSKNHNPSLTNKSFNSPFLDPIVMVYK